MAKEKKDSNKFIKLASSGTIDFELSLILTEQEAELYNINPKKIHKVSDCLNFLSNQGNNFFITSQNQKQKLNIFENIRLYSNNNSLNTLLIINKAFKKKIFIEYVTMNTIKFPEENSFMKDVLKNVTEQNFLFLVENKFLGNLDSKIKFVIKINNKIIASFENICDNNHIENDSNTNINIRNNIEGFNSNENFNNSKIKSESERKILENSKENMGTYPNSNKEKNSENENKFNEILKDISNKIYDDFQKQEKNLVEHSPINSNKELTVMENDNNNNNEIDNNSDFILKEKDKEDINLNEKNSFSLNKINNNIDNIDININSPVRNKLEKTINEADLTADKIINDIHIQNNKSNSNNSLSNSNLNTKINKDVNNIEDILQQNSKSEKDLSIHNMNNLQQNSNLINENNNNLINEFKEEENIFEKFRYDFNGCNYFLIDIEEIISLKKYNFSLLEFNEFLSKIIEDFPEINIISNFPNLIKNISNLDPESISVLGNIIKETDIHIFDKKESLHFFNLMHQMSNNDPIKQEAKSLQFLYIKELKKKNNQSPKIGIFFENFKKVTFIQQQTNSDFVVFHSDYIFEIIPPNVSNKIRSEYEKIFEENFEQLKSVFIGGVLSRLFHKKSFNNCFTAGNEVVKRVIELMRFNLDPPEDINYFLIKIKKEPKGKSEEEKNIQKKEELFVLDSTNKLKSQMKSYNPLHDNNLNSFFSSKITKAHLTKTGFINRNGDIVDDPDKRKIIIFEDKKILQNYENEKNNLQKIKDKKENMKKELKSLLNNNMKNLRAGSLKDLEKLSKIYTYNPLKAIGKNKMQQIDLKNSAMKATKFKNSQYLKQISKGEKPVSLFDMKNTVSVNKNPDKSLSPNKIKLGSIRVTSNRFISLSTQKNFRQTGERFNNTNTDTNTNNKELSTKFSPNRTKSNSINNFGNNNKTPKNFTLRNNHTSDGFRNKINIQIDADIANGNKDFENNLTEKENKEENNQNENKEEIENIEENMDKNLLNEENEGVNDKENEEEKDKENEEEKDKENEEENDKENEEENDKENEELKNIKTNENKNVENKENVENLENNELKETDNNNNPQKTQNFSNQKTEEKKDKIPSEYIDDEEMENKELNISDGIKVNTNIIQSSN